MKALLGCDKSNDILIDAENENSLDLAWVFSSISDAEAKLQIRMLTGDVRAKVDMQAGTNFKIEMRNFGIDDYLPTPYGILQALKDFQKNLDTSTAKPKWKNLLRKNIDEVIIMLGDPAIIGIELSSNAGKREVLTRLYNARKLLSKFNPIYAEFKERVNPDEQFERNDLLPKSSFNPGWFSYDVVKEHTDIQFRNIARFLHRKEHFEIKRLGLGIDIRAAFIDLENACADIMDKWERKVALSYSEDVSLADIKGRMKKENWEAWCRILQENPELVQLIQGKELNDHYILVGEAANLPIANLLHIALAESLDLAQGAMNEERAKYEQGLLEEWYGHRAIADISIEEIHWAANLSYIIEKAQLDTLDTVEVTKQIKIAKKLNLRRLMKPEGQDALKYVVSLYGDQLDDGNEAHREIKEELRGIIEKKLPLLKDAQEGARNEFVKIVNESPKLKDKLKNLSLFLMIFLQVMLSKENKTLDELLEMNTMMRVEGLRQEASAMDELRFDVLEVLQGDEMISFDLVDYFSQIRGDQGFSDTKVIYGKDFDKVDHVSTILFGLEENNYSAWNVEGMNFTQIENTPSWIDGGLDEAGDFSYKRLFNSIKNEEANLEGACLRDVPDLEPWMKAGLNKMGVYDIYVLLRKIRDGFKDFMNADLRDAQFFYDMDLRDVDFENANLKSANFDRVKMTRINFRGSKLDDADLRGVDIAGGTFENSSLIGVLLDGAKLVGVKGLPDWIEQGLLEDGKFSMRRLVARVKEGFSDLSEVNMIEFFAFAPVMDFEGVKFRKDKDLPDYLRAGCGEDWVFRRDNLYEAVVAGFNNLEKAYLDGFDFKRFDLEGIRFDGAKGLPEWVEAGLDEDGVYRKKILENKIRRQV